jgi:hypothetical protein
VSSNVFRTYVYRDVRIDRTEYTERLYPFSKKEREKQNELVIQGR